MNHFESTNTHFLDGEEKFSKIKILQTNLVIFSFTLTILLHIVEIVLYYFVDG